MTRGNGLKGRGKGFDGEQKRKCETEDEGRGMREEKSESLGGENLHGSHVWLRRRAWRAFLLGDGNSAFGLEAGKKARKTRTNDHDAERCQRFTERTQRRPSPSSSRFLSCCAPLLEPDRTFWSRRGRIPPPAAGLIDSAYVMDHVMRRLAND